MKDNFYFISLIEYHKMVRLQNSSWMPFFLHFQYHRSPTPFPDRNLERNKVQDYSVSMPCPLLIAPYIYWYIIIIVFVCVDIVVVSSLHLFFYFAIWQDFCEIGSVSISSLSSFDDWDSLSQTGQWTNFICYCIL